MEKEVRLRRHPVSNNQDTELREIELSRSTVGKATRYLSEKASWYHLALNKTWSLHIFLSKWAG